MWSSFGPVSELALMETMAFTACLSSAHLVTFVLAFWLGWSARGAESFRPFNVPSPRSVSIDEDDSTIATPTLDADDSFKEACLALEARVPKSTEAERRRFLTARKCDVDAAADMLVDYVEWHLKHAVLEQKLPDIPITGDGDLDDWNQACAVAMAADDEPLCFLPRVARTFTTDSGNARCRQGYRIISIIPGLMDDSLVPLETYSLAIALYIDRKLSRGKEERLTVLIDARGGVGWPNRNAAQLLPFIKHTCRLLLSMFPERLARSVVFPVPFAFGWIWSVAQRFIDPVTAEKIGLLTGPATIHANPPFAQLVDYLDEPLAHKIESERRAAFIHA